MFGQISVILNIFIKYIELYYGTLIIILKNLSFGMECVFYYGKKWSIFIISNEFPFSHKLEVSFGIKVSKILQKTHRAWR